MFTLLCVAFIVGAVHAELLFLAWLWVYGK